MQRIDPTPTTPNACLPDAGIFQKLEAHTPGAKEAIVAIALRLQQEERDSLHRRMKNWQNGAQELARKFGLAAPVPATHGGYQVLAEIGDFERRAILAYMKGKNIDPEAFLTPQENATLSLLKLQPAPR